MAGAQTKVVGGPIQIIHPDLDGIEVAPDSPVPNAIFSAAGRRGAGEVAIKPPGKTPTYSVSRVLDKTKPAKDAVKKWPRHSTRLTLR